MDARRLAARDDLAAIAGEKFAEYFYANSQDEAISAYLKSVSAEPALA